MKTAKENLSPTRVKLTVEVPFEDLKPNLDAAYKNIGSQIQVPGFRKGKVPAAIIDQRVGRDAVLSEAVNDALPNLYTAALTESEVVPLSQPELDLSKLEYGESLEFTVELDVRPEIELPDLTGIVAEVPDIEVSDEDIEAEIEGLRERFAELTEVDRAAADGDHVTVDLSASKDGEKIAAAQAEDLPYQLGKGTMLEGLDEAIIGLSKGESKTFETQLAGGDLAGEDVQVEVTLKDVKQADLPDVDDEFAQLVSEFDTVDEFKNQLTERLEQNKRLEQAQAARDSVLEQVVELVEAPLPENVVTEEIQNRKDQITQQLAYAGMALEQYLDNEEQTVDEFEADLEKRVRDSFVAQFVLDEIVARDELGVENDELMQHIVRRAQESGQDPQSYIQHAMEHNHVAELAGEVVRAKALQTLVESATIKDASGNTIDLKELTGEAATAEPDSDES